MAWEYEALKVERNGSVLTVTLNRPERRNAISPKMHVELANCFFELRQDRETRVVVLTGAGSSFSVGGDMTDAAPTASEFIQKDATEAREIVHGLLQCPHPIICRMNGDAVGLGATMALMCDFVIAANSGRIGDPHVRMGLVAGDGGALVWPLLIGPMLAKYYLLTGDLLGAPEAAKLGLITRSVEDAALDAEVAAIIDKLLAGAPLAQQLTKRSINAALTSMAALQLDLSLAYEGMTLLSVDHAEARQAFVAKRKPQFKGE